jgi:hypothetical protein
MQHIPIHLRLIHTQTQLMKLISTFLICAALAFSARAQTINPPKKLPAKRTVETPKIDGIIEDNIWKDAPVADNFVEFRPAAGAPEPKNKRTDVKILYDNVAIYVAARMYDNPDSIAHELVSRDDIGNADFVGIIFDTFLDGINGYGFYVAKTLIGVQYGKARLNVTNWAGLQNLRSLIRP